MRLIDADELKKSVPTNLGVPIWQIDNAPTIDAVEVVRCKDCKHNSLNRIIGNTYCDLGIGLYQLYDYCSHGERREDD